MAADAYHVKLSFYEALQNAVKLFHSGSHKLSYSVNTTDCTPEISKRLRQRMFLQAIMSSLRSM